MATKTYTSKFVEEWMISTTVNPRPPKKPGFRDSVRAFAKKIKKHLRPAAPLVIRYEAISAAPGPATTSRLPSPFRPSVVRPKANNASRSVSTTDHPHPSPPHASAVTPEVKGGWTRIVHPRLNVDGAASLRQAGGADGPTDSTNGQGQPRSQAGGADGHTNGDNGTAPRDSATDAKSTISTERRLRLNLDEMRRTFERNRNRPQRHYERRGAAMQKQDVVLDTIYEVE